MASQNPVDFGFLTTFIVGTVALVLAAIIVGAMPAQKPTIKRGPYDALQTTPIENPPQFIVSPPGAVQAEGKQTMCGDVGCSYAATPYTFKFFPVSHPFVANKTGAVATMLGSVNLANWGANSSSDLVVRFVFADPAILAGTGTLVADKFPLSNEFIAPTNYEPEMQSTGVAVQQVGVEKVFQPTATSLVMGKTYQLMAAVTLRTPINWSVTWPISVVELMDNPVTVKGNSGVETHFTCTGGGYGIYLRDPTDNRRLWIQNMSAYRSLGNDGSFTAQADCTGFPAAQSAPRSVPRNGDTWKDVFNRRFNAA